MQVGSERNDLKQGERGNQFQEHVNHALSPTALDEDVDRSRYP